MQNIYVAREKDLIVTKIMALILFLIICEPREKWTLSQVVMSLKYKKILTQAFPCISNSISLHVFARD